MLIVFKILLVAFAVFGQAKLFPEHAASEESGLDSLALPVERPELVLAKRAMEAQGLCRGAEKAEAAGAKEPMADWDASVGKAAARRADASDAEASPQAGEASKHDLATNCP